MIAKANPIPVSEINSDDHVSLRAAMDLEPLDAKVMFDVETYCYYRVQHGRSVDQRMMEALYSAAKHAKVGVGALTSPKYKFSRNFPMPVSDEAVYCRIVGEAYARRLSERDENTKETQAILREASTRETRLKETWGTHPYGGDSEFPAEIEWAAIIRDAYGIASALAEELNKRMTEYDEYAGVERE